MAYTGDPLPKRMIQAALRPLGYRVVRLAPYEARTSGATRPGGRFSKVFGIGFNKTSTTTLEQVLRGWGLKMPKQLDQERILADVADTGDFGRLAAFCADYDAFQDLPFSQTNVYVACDALFPGAKFVLTLRDPGAWADSYIRFYRREYGFGDQAQFAESDFVDRALYLERGYVHRVLRRMLVEPQAGQPVVRWDLAFDRDFLIDIYQRRNAEVRAHFRARPDDLFQLDPSAETDTARLAAFLGLEEGATGPYPRANAG